MKETIKECPYCGSERVSLRSYGYEHDEYFCETCECWFTELDVEVEDLRHEIYNLLVSDYSEENPLRCDIAIDAEYLVVSCFAYDGDGTIWFTLSGETEPRDFDDFNVEELREILKGLQQTI